MVLNFRNQMQELNFEDEDEKEQFSDIVVDQEEKDIVPEKEVQVASLTTPPIEEVTPVPTEQDIAIESPTSTLERVQAYSQLAFNERFSPEKPFDNIVTDMEKDPMYRNIIEKEKEEEKKEGTFTERAIKGLEVIGKDLVYGVGRRGILGSAEFIGEAPAFVSQVVHGRVLTRALNEAFRATVKGVTRVAEIVTFQEPEELQIKLSNMYGYAFGGDDHIMDKNYLDYVDIFDSFSDLDKVYDENFYGTLNAGVDIVTRGKVTNLFSRTDDEGREVKGDYQKFVDHIFKFYDVPPEEQNYVGRVVMTGGEFIVPLGAYRTTTGKIADTVEGQIKKYTKHKDKTIATISRVQKRIDDEPLTGVFGQKMPKRTSAIRYRERLEKGLQKTEKKINDLAFNQRHYGAGQVSASLASEVSSIDIPRNMKQYLSPTLVSVFKNEASTALMASTAMGSTEGLLENAGLDHLKPAAMVSALAGGMLGVTGLKKGLSTAKNLIIYGVKANTNDPTRFDPMLRIRGYTQESIDKMTFKQKSEIAVTDPQTLKMGRKIGEIFADLQRTDPEMYEKITQGITFSRELSEKFRNDLLSDLENGFIKREDFGYLDENLPLLLDQTVMLSGLNKLRDTLVSNLSNSGLTMNVPRFAAQSELDSLITFLDKQSDQIFMNLENIEKRIKKDIGGRESFSSVIIKNITEFTEDYNTIGRMAKSRLEELKKIKETEVHPINQHEFKKTMEDFFGKDDMDAFAIHKEQGGELQNAFDIAEQNRLAFGDGQAELLQSSYNSMKKLVKEKYDAVEDFDIDVDEIFRDNSFATTLLESSDALKIYEKELSPMTGRLESLVKAGRVKGLNRAARESESPALYIDRLIKMDISHDAAMGLTRTREEMLEYKNNVNKEIADLGYEEVIKDLRKTLINKPVTMLDDANNTVLIGRKIKNADDDSVVHESIIPMYMSFKDLNRIKTRAMDNAFVRNRRTGGMTKDFNKRQEANVFVHTIDNKIDSFIKSQGLSELGITENSFKMLKEAKEFYKNTLGATFKRRLGTYLKTQSGEEVIETVESLPNEKLFELFLTHKDKKQSAQMFRSMFSELDAKGNVIPDTVNPEAKNLLLKAARRLITSETGGNKGLKALTQETIESFFNSKEGPNLFKDMDDKVVKDFLNWKKIENEYINNSAFKYVFDDPKYQVALDSAIESLSLERKDVLDRSFFGALNRKVTSGQLKAEDIFAQTEVFHAANEPLSVALKRATSDTDTTYGMSNYRDLKRHIETVDDLRAREALLDEDDAGLLSEMVGPPRIKDVSEPVNAVRVIIDAFEGQPEKQEKVILALRGLFVKNIMEKAYKTTDTKRYKNVNTENTSPFRLVRDVDLGAFSDIMANEANIKMMEDLWQSGGPAIRDPEQLDRLKRILDMEIIAKGKKGKLISSVTLPTQMAVNSLISRVYSISRGVVSPKYVASEIYITQAQLRKGNFMLKMMTDPNITITVEEAMAVATNQMNLTPEFMKKFYAMSTTLFLTQMGEEDSSTVIKQPTWLRKTFRMLGNFLKSSSVQYETGVSPEQPIEDNAIRHDIDKFITPRDSIPQ